MSLCIILKTRSSLASWHESAISIAFGKFLKKSSNSWSIAICHSMSAGRSGEKCLDCQSPKFNILFDSNLHVAPLSIRRLQSLPDRRLPLLIHSQRKIEYEVMSYILHILSNMRAKDLLSENKDEKYYSWLNE